MPDDQPVICGWCQQSMPWPNDSEPNQESACPACWPLWIEETAEVRTSTAPPPTRMPLSVREAAAAMRVTEGTVREWLRAGKLRGIKLSDSHKDRWRIPLAEINRFTE